ncbi:hypothetical protein [Actinacidiphila rubida]|uniref:hypothetical protein n=1 Tax=Actinacidiphila rubida TaxID=310780 RepID=UPI0008497C13|nr:hypothetical protein [Actinacidiphila rubida]
MGLVEVGVERGAGTGDDPLDGVEQAAVLQEVFEELVELIGVDCCEVSGAFVQCRSAGLGVGDGFMGMRGQDVSVMFGSGLGGLGRPAPAVLWGAGLGGARPVRADRSWPSGVCALLRRRWSSRCPVRVTVLLS